MNEWINDPELKRHNWQPYKLAMCFSTNGERDVTIDYGSDSFI